MTITIKLDTPSGRAKCTTRPAPYWQRIDTGKYIGYRAGPDTWIARHYSPERGNLHRALGTATALTFTQAKDAAEAWFASLADGASPHYTVEQCVRDYVEHRRLENGQRSADEAEQELARTVLPKFGKRQVSSLTSIELDRWRKALVPADLDEEAQRQAKLSANRRLCTFKAALSVAFKVGRVASDTPWRRVRPFRYVDKAREFCPTTEQVAALIDACENDFRPLVHAAAITGYRLGVLRHARVGDFDPVKGALRIRHDKHKRHARDATLSTAAVALFKEQARDKLPGAYLFLRADGLPWGTAHQHRPFRDACTKAALPREFVFYSLRHYFASKALTSGMNVHALAKTIGTSAAMIEEVYAKWIKDDVRAMLDRVEVA